MPHSAAEAATDSVAGAHEVAGQMGGSGEAKLIAAAERAFIEAITTAASIAAGVALLGAFLALAFLPSRARSESTPRTADHSEAVTA